eukprot:2931012-Rhodomonas_salina.1
MYGPRRERHAESRSASAVVRNGARPFSCQGQLSAGGENLDADEGPASREGNSYSHEDVVVEPQLEDAVVK